MADSSSQAISAATMLEKLRPDNPALVSLVKRELLRLLIGYTLCALIVAFATGFFGATLAMKLHAANVKMEIRDAFRDSQKELEDEQNAVVAKLKNRDPLVIELMRRNKIEY